MSWKDEGVVVLYRHTEMTITEYGNECLTKHKPHKTPPKPLDLFLHLTLMSLEEESMLVMDTHTKLAFTEYGNEYLTKHKPHETPPMPLYVFFT